MNLKNQASMAFMASATSVLALTTVLSLAACSNGGGSSPKKYSSSTAALEEVATNLNRIEQSAKNTNSANMQQLVMEEKASTSAPSDNDVILKEKAQRMQQALSRCQVQFISSDDASKSPDADPQVFAAGLKISGTCPLSADYLLKMSSSARQNETRLNLDMKMKITDSSLATMNDVYEAQISGNMSLNSSTANGSLQGQVLSIKYGPVKVSGTIKGSNDHKGSNVAGAISFEINGEITEITFNMTSDEKNQLTESYTINGKPVSKSEAKALMAKLPFLGGGQTTQLLGQ